MVFHKMVVMVPQLAPPHPNDVDGLTPLAREIMNVLIKEWKQSNTVSSATNLEYSHPNITLSPIPELGDEKIWENIELTVDKGLRRNKKKIAQAEENISKILATTKKNEKDNNLERNNNNGNQKIVSEFNQQDKEVGCYQKNSNDLLNTTQIDDNSFNKKIILNTKQKIINDTESDIDHVNNDDYNSQQIKNDLKQFQLKPSLLGDVENTAEDQFEKYRDDKLHPKNNGQNDDTKKINDVRISIIKHKLKQFVFETKDDETEENVENKDIFQNEHGTTKTIINEEQLIDVNEIDESPLSEMKQKINILDVCVLKSPNKISVNSYKPVNQKSTKNLLTVESAMNDNITIESGQRGAQQQFDYFQSKQDGLFDQNDAIDRSIDYVELPDLNFDCIDNLKIENLQTTDNKTDGHSAPPSNCFGKTKDRQAINPDTPLLLNGLGNDQEIANNFVGSTSHAFTDSKAVTEGPSVVSEQLDFIEEWLECPVFNDVLRDEDESVAANAPANTSKPFLAPEMPNERTEQKPNPADLSDALAQTKSDKHLGICHSPTHMFAIRNKPAKSKNKKEKSVKSNGKNAKKQKTIQRGTYVMEVDYSKPGTPPKTKQLKITNLLKPVKRRPSGSEVKHEPDSAPAPTIRAEENSSKDDKTKKKRKRKSNESPNKENASKKKKNLKTNEKKAKMPPPPATRTAHKCVDYDYIVLDDLSAVELGQQIESDRPVEICFNVVYREGFCQISQPAGARGGRRTPAGVVLGVSWVADGLSRAQHCDFYYLSLSRGRWRHFDTPKSLLSICLGCECSKLCLGAQAFCLLLMGLFGFPGEQVVLRWSVADPLVGCWLLDPDSPPATFKDLLLLLGLSPGCERAAGHAGDVRQGACDAIVALAAAADRLYAALRENDLWTLFLDVEMKIARILAVMEHHGVRVDTALLKRAGEQVRLRLEAVERDAHGCAGRPFQMNSTVQARAILYDELKLDSQLGVRVKETSALGAKSTSEPMLRLLRGAHQLPGLILEYRHLHKAKSTFVDSVLLSVKDGKVYTSWEQTSTATGRVASTNPNLQTIPKRPFPLSLFPENADDTGGSVSLRSPYTAAEGHSLLAADFQHIELRVFAHLSQDVTIVNAINAQGDVFSNLSSVLFGDKTDEKREQTKRIVYAVMYGAGVHKLADILSLPVEQASVVLRKFTNIFSGLQEFKRKTIENCRAKGYLKSILGRIRKFPNINSDVLSLRAQSERQAVNFCIQGSAADICKMAMISAMEKLCAQPDLECKLLLQIHDELVWEIHDAHLEKVKCIIRETMEHSDTVFGKVRLSVPLPVTIKVGRNWGHMA